MRVVVIALLLCAAVAQAQDWRAKYPVVGMGAVSSESQGATAMRLKLFLDLQSLDPKLAEVVVRGKTQGYVEVSHAMYQPILDAVLEQHKARRRK